MDKENKQLEASKLVSVQLASLGGGRYDYLCPPGMELVAGEVVLVPFGRRQLIGVVWATGISSQLPLAKLRAVVKKFPRVLVSRAQRLFVDQVANYWLAPVGSVLKLLFPLPEVLLDLGEEVYCLAPVPAESRRLGTREKVVVAYLAEQQQPVSKKILLQQTGATSKVLQQLVTKRLLHHQLRLPPDQPTEPPAPPSLQLTPAQETAYQQLLQLVKNKQTALFYGTTGSGKTELCFRLAKQLVEQGKQVLLLMPEIALAAHATKQFRAKLGEQRVLEWHSGVSRSEKRATWLRISRGSPAVVVGARSALFLPYQNLGLLVVEEEQDRSYKQESGVLYHARDAARWLAAYQKSPLLLVTASPSIETTYLVQKGEYQLIKLLAHGDRPAPPPIEKIEMDKERLPAGRWLSAPLLAALAATKQKGQQSLLFLNRRGYSPLTFCKSCGYRFVCKKCSCWLVCHSSKLGETQLFCHYCGHRRSLPAACPSCRQNNFCFWGPGCEKLAEELAELLPELRILVLTSDQLQTVGSVQRNLQLILDGQVDVIIGTQVLAKGHNFPLLTLVGLIDTDSSKAGGDLRGYERVYQQLTQVAGRAGRFALASCVYLQTYAPQDPFINQVVQRDLAGFLGTELRLRQENFMPPFSRLVAFILRCRDEAALTEAFQQLRRARPTNSAVQVWGPAPALIKKIAGYYRWRYLLRAPLDFPLQDFIRSWLAKAELNKQRRVRLVVDVDPYSFS